MSSEEKAVDAFDEDILRMLQGDIPLCPHPYRELALKHGTDEKTVIDRINALKERGHIRRVSAILNHRRAGYTVNVLTAWSAVQRDGETREEALDRVGGILASCDAISHCYARKLVPGWELPVFAMFHAPSEDAMRGYIDEMKAKLPGETVRILPTVKEWKKVSMRYFKE